MEMRQFEALDIDVLNAIGILAACVRRSSVIVTETFYLSILVDSDF